MSNLRKWKVGVIGLGAIGKGMTRELHKHPATEVVAVADLSSDAVREVTESLHIQAGYTDYRSLLEECDIDLVYVAVPPASHHQVVLDALHAGKHVLCEKPLANSIAEAVDMLDAARKAEVVHAINFPLHYKAVVREMENLIRSGFLGELCRVEVTMHFPQWPRSWQQNSWIAGRAQGGFVREVAPHFLQLIMRLFGPIREQTVESRVDWPEDKTACETGIVGTFLLESGVRVLIDGISGVAKAEEVALTAYGTEGMLSLVNWGTLKGGRKGEGMETIPVEENGSYAIRLIEQLDLAMQGKPAQLCDFAVGQDVQVVLDKLLKGQE